MNPGRDPLLLEPEQRLAEVAALLSVGYRRLLQKRQEALDALGQPEAPCADAVLRKTENSAAGRTA